MKKLFCLFSTLLVLTATAQTPQDSVAIVSAAWHATRLKGGAELRTAQLRAFNSEQTLSVIVCKSAKYAIKFVQHGGVRKTSLTATENRADWAVNASYWNVKTDIPVAYVRIDGKELYNPLPNEKRCDGAVATSGRGIRILRGQPDSYAEWAREYDNIFVAGSVLLLGGKNCDLDAGKYMNKRHPRTAIGTTADGRIVAIVADGRVKDKAQGLTLSELAFVARVLGTTDAINLDGGGSSVMWTASDGVINHPCDNRLYDHAGERKVSSAILFKSGKFKKAK